MSEATIKIERIGTETLFIPIVGTTPIIINRFSEKAKRQMLDNMQGKKTAKTARNPQADYKAAFYHLKDGRPGFPALGFKQATVGAARFYSNVRMTELRQSIFFRGEPGSDGRSLVAIEGEPHMREDLVKLSPSSTDLRYRPEFPEWCATLEVTYVKSLLTRDSLLSLIDAGGMGCGVGEWRPEKKGDFGTYTLDESREVDVL